MDRDEENPMVSAIDAISLQPVQTLIPPVIPIPITLPIAPIPALSAPLSVRPPVVKPPPAQSGDSITRVSDSDHEESARRLDRAKMKKDAPDEDSFAEVDWSLKQPASLGLECSEMGDDRPLSGCSLSFDGNMLATCSLSGIAKVWSMPELKKVFALKGHTERATDVAFAPNSYQLATASADKTAKLWNFEGSLLRTFEGHVDRLGRIAFHPSGKKLGTASFDKSWRLWDVETGKGLLSKTGTEGVYGIAFHHDGSLVASCGLDSLARVWDLRSRESVLAFEGHVKPALSVSFSPSGYHLATGGEDNTCRIWDMRKPKCLFIILAHSNLISQVKFEPNKGSFLATASYDRTAKIWSSRDFKPVKTDNVLQLFHMIDQSSYGQAKESGKEKAPMEVGRPNYDFKAITIPKTRKQLTKADYEKDEQQKLKIVIQLSVVQLFCPFSFSFYQKLVNLIMCSSVMSS